MCVCVCVCVCACVYVCCVCVHVSTRMQASGLLCLSSYKDATCLVTISEGKFFTLGLDLDLLATATGQEMTQFMADLQNLYRRLLTFPLVTVAAVNGTQLILQNQ